MDDRTLIETIYAGTIPRIKDIRDVYSREADAELAAQIAAGDWPELAGRTLAPLDAEAEERLTRAVWHATLSDVSVEIIRAVCARATDGVFAADEASIAAACASIDDAAVKRDTGLRPEHVRPVLEKAAEAFLEAVRAEGVVELSVDGVPFRVAARA